MRCHGHAHTALTPEGHAHHFLSRLDRVARAHVEVALMLYRDEDLLRFILERARLPEGVGRVAVALGDARRGPFVIVTRDAHFVTCLGEDMRPGTCAIITRTQLDALIVRAREMRERNLALLELGAQAKDLYKRVIVAADLFSREQMVAATAHATPIRAHLVTLAAQVADDLNGARKVLVPILRRTRNIRTPAHPALRVYWKLAFAVGHLSVLASVDGPGLVEMLPPLAGEFGPMLSLLSVQQGMTSVALKGIWAAGKVGRELLSSYKRVFAESTYGLQIADAALGLTVLGLRHARLRAEVYKALAPMHGGVERSEETQRLAAALSSLGRATLDDPEKGLAAHRRYGSERIVRMTADLPADSPWRFTRPEDVPEDLAMTAGASVMEDFLADRRHLAGMFVMLPWLARAKARDLYLPAGLIRATRVPWRPAHTIAMMAGHCARPRLPKPSEPSRSGPCPCGSGMKFKRCCGDERPGAELSKAA